LLLLENSKILIKLNWAEIRLIFFSYLIHAFPHSPSFCPSKHLFFTLFSFLLKTLSFSYKLTLSLNSHCLILTLSFSLKLSHSLTISFFLLQTLSFSYKLFLSLTNSFFLLQALSFAYKLSFFLQTLSFSHKVSLSLPNSLFPLQTISLSYKFSLSLTNSLFLLQTLSFFYNVSLSLTNSISHLKTLSFSHKLSLSLTNSIFILQCLSFSYKLFLSLKNSLSLTNSIFILQTIFLFSYKFSLSISNNFPSVSLCFCVYPAVFVLLSILSLVSYSSKLFLSLSLCDFLGYYNLCNSIVIPQLCLRNLVFLFIYPFRHLDIFSVSNSSLSLSAKTHLHTPTLFATPTLCPSL
jgi:hypothetical protein